MFCNFLCCFQQISKNRPGAMWHYVVLSQNLKKQLFISFLLPVFPAFRKSKKTSLALYGGIAESEKNRCFNVIALCGVAPRLQFSANVYNSRGLYGVSKECQRQECSQCCFRCLQNMSQKILVELCGGCPALQNEHVFNFGIHGVMRFEVVAKRVEIARIVLFQCTFRCCTVALIRVVSATGHR